VLFSASYQPRHPFLLFWTSTRVQIVTSLYAVDEARRNISSESHLDSLNSLLAQTQLITDYGDGLPEEVSLPPKDRPIFCAAIAAGRSIFSDRRQETLWKIFRSDLRYHIRTSHGDRTGLSSSAVEEISLTQPLPYNIAWT
jgi:hypothetical protein